MKIKFLVMVLLLFLFAKKDAYSQYGVQHELGVIVGPVLLYSDYGERNNFETNTNNVGFGIGVIHYLNFAHLSGRRNYFNDHFKIRNEFDYHKTNLKHYGQWVADDRTSEGAEKLRQMSGSSSIIEIGSQLEYYPLDIREFEYGQFKISPFVSLGMHWVAFSPTAETSYGTGTVKDNANLIPKYYNSFQREAASTWAVVGSVGFRYRLNDTSDLMLDSRWQYYFSDYVDGLNPTPENNGGTPVPENKSNDWIYWLNVGYIYYFD